MFIIQIKFQEDAKQNDLDGTYAMTQLTMIGCPKGIFWCGVLNN